MAMVLPPETEYAKEMRKWEPHHTQWGPPGRPYTKQIYPTRMYKCERGKDGTRTFDGQTAQDEHEQRNLESRGFVVGGQQAALDALDRIEFSHAELHAELNYEAKHKLSLSAKAEYESAEAAAGARHIAVVPETPIKRKGGRPKKALATD